MYPKIPHMMAVRVCDVCVGREGGGARAVREKLNGSPSEAVWQV